MPLILNCMRFYRNKSVHAALDAIGRENVVRLHGYVGDLLLFALQSRMRFRSLEELGRFLGQPTAEGVLQDRHYLAAEALHFHGFTPRRRRRRVGGTS